MMVIDDAYLLILISLNFSLQVEVSVALSPVHNPAHILGSPAIPNPGIPTIPTIPNHGIPTIPSPNPSPPKAHPPSHPTHTVAPSCSDSLLVEVITTITHHHTINITHQVHVSTTNNCLLRRPSPPLPSPPPTIKVIKSPAMPTFSPPPSPPDHQHPQGRTK